MTEIGRVNKHKTTHQDGGDDEIDATGLTGRCDFVDRGDPASVDFGVSDFTVSEAWKDLDLSSIIPTNTKAISALLNFQAPSNSEYVYLRTKGNSNEINKSAIRTQVANVQQELDCIIYTGGKTSIQYWGPTTNFSVLNFTVKGWWI